MNNWIIISMSTKRKFLRYTLSLSVIQSTKYIQYTHNEQRPGAFCRDAVFMQERNGHKHEIQ